ncbi:MAG: carboxy terminal-processing peptidase [Bacteroidetes bacterium]|nr:carboxy terminal-processing peptidase [Bacteroidota bacterium]
MIFSKNLDLGNNSAKTMWRTIFTAFFLLAFLKNNLAQKVQTEFSVGIKAGLLVEVINKHHCQPKILNDEFSKLLFDNYILNIDPDKDILTNGDLKQIINHRVNLDEQIKSKNIVFIPKISQIIKLRLLFIDSLLVSLSEKPINLNNTFSVNSQYDSLANDNNELRVRIQRKLKYRIFNQLYLKILDTSNYTIPKHYEDPQNLVLEEKKVRKLVLEKYRKEISRIVQSPVDVFLKNYEDLFLQTIAQIYDPHTEYFENEEVKSFFNSISPENEVFGFSLDENKKGEILITGLFPGGPAWKSGLINEGDLLMSFSFEDGKIINTLGEDLEEIELIMQENKGKIINLTLRKSSKEIVSVSLRKELVLQENETVRGFILNKNGNFGYINLPSFYSDEESDNASGCSNDVAKELIKMQADGIKGLILDLRFNGGGSVKEALDLAGIFIDQGVFGAAKPYKGKSLLMKDPNRGSVYDGPMVVLVNKGSASASEILAAILQDYNRAIIVGSATYGKGVAQSIYALDSNSQEPRFYTKVTHSRIYRPSGNSLQHAGVLPDIALPSILKNIVESEKNEAFSVLPEPLDRNLNILPGNKPDILTLSKKSKTRIENSPGFKAIEKVSSFLTKYSENEKNALELNWNSFCNIQNDENKNFQDLKSVYNVNEPLFKVNIPSHDKSRIQMDEFWNALNERLTKQISKDIYINESLEILNNLNE